MLTQNEKEELLSAFPNIKLSYENILHKKVLSINDSLIIGIPEGKKCFAWFTTYKDKCSCFILELDNKSKKQIKNIRLVNSCFSSSLCYGTIFYGTLFSHMNNSFFSIEDIFLYKGKDVTNNFFAKINQIGTILKNDIKQVSYNNYFVVFGLPIIAKSIDKFEENLSKITYKLSSIQYRKNDISYILPFDKFMNKQEDLPMENSLNMVTQKPVTQKPVTQKPVTQKPVPQKYNKIFTIKPDIQNDIYNLYSIEDNEYVGLACIPDYKTSVMMNKLFRNIKENNDLDALEESDSEDEFENPSVDKFVYLDKSYKMLCSFNNKFKKWVPIKIIE